MAGFKIAEGYLEIDADTDAALGDIKGFFKEVDKELDAEEKSFSTHGKKSGKAYADSIQDGAKVSESFKKLTEDAFKTVESESDKRGGLLGAMLAGGGGKKGRAGRGIISSILPSRGLLTRLFDPIRRGGRGLLSGLGNLFSKGSSLFSGISKGIADAFSSGLDQAQQIWKGASKVFDSIGSVGSGVGGILQVGAWALAVPLILGLAGALLQLSAAALALPAALSVAVAAIAPLIIAFHGFGEAISAGFSGDVDKFNEALKGLAPNARKVAKEIVGLKPLLSQLKNSVQEAFFGPLVGQLTKLGNTLLPNLWWGMSHVAGALGQIAAGFTNLLSSKPAITAINNVFMTTERILNTMGPALVNTFGAFLNLINAGLPWVEKFSAVLAGGLQNVAGWINKTVAPGGKFTGWMERAWHIGQLLWDVIKGAGQYLFTLLNAFGDEGTDTLNGISKALKQMNDYLKTSQGQETLHNLGVLVHWAGNAFVFLLEHFTTAWKGLNAFFNFIRGIGPFFSNLWDSIVSGAKAVGNWFVWLGETVWGALVTAYNAVVGFGKAVWGALVIAYNAVVGAGKAVIDWFTSLPRIIGNFIASIPGIIAREFQRMIDTVLFGVGFLAGIIWKFFTDQLPRWIAQGFLWAVGTTTAAVNSIVGWLVALPGRVLGALVAFGGMLVQWFTSAWEWAKNATVSAIWAINSWINALPGRISGALSALLGAIGGWFFRAWAWAKEAMVSGISTVNSWINRVPGIIKGALSGAGSWLYNAGKDIISGLVNGIGDALSWAVNRARDAAHKIKEGFESALGINSPSRVMRMEVGRWILPGVIQGMEDTKPNFDRYLGMSAARIAAAHQPIVNVAAPNVAVGGVTLIADLGDGIRQAVPVHIMRNSTVVATAANVGNRRRAAWTNTGRTVITGS